MKRFARTLCLIAGAFLLAGCVTRTYVDAPENRGPTNNKSYGSKSNERVKETKRVWFWQDEFRNP